MGNTPTKGKGRGNYTRQMEVRSCTAPNCTELFQAAVGRQAAYCSAACKQTDYRWRKWKAQREAGK